MTSLALSIIDDFKDELSDLESLPPLSRYAQGKEYALEAINNLYGVVFDGENPNEYVIIRYNKEWLPALLTKAIFYECCYQLEFQKQNGHPGYLAAFIDSKFADVDRFFQDNAEFCRYYDRQGDSRNRALFANSGVVASPTDLEKFGLPPNIKANSLLIATIPAYREFSVVLKEEFARLGPVNFSMSSRTSPKEKLPTYKGTKIGLVELTTALYARGEILIDGKPATLDYVNMRIGNALNVDLKDHKVMRSRLSDRVKDEAPFLRELSKTLEEYIDQSLNGEHPDKKLKKLRRKY
jgi:hypothetical protein